MLLIILKVKVWESIFFFFLFHPVWGCLLKCLFSCYILYQTQPSLYCSNPFLIQNKTLCLDFQYFLSVSDTGSFCISAPPLCFLCCLSQSSSDSGCLSPFVVSNMDKEQRRNSPGEWDAKRAEKHLINLPSFWLYFSSCDLQTQTFVFIKLCLLNAFITPPCGTECGFAVAVCYYLVNECKCCDFYWFISAAV